MAKIRFAACFLLYLLFFSQGCSPSGHDKTSAQDKPVDVIVVGAGISGLAAAHDLKDKGYKVVVLEARDRVGGRIWTSRKWEDGPVELGASWIHEIENNPIKKLADDLKVETKPVVYDSFVLYKSDGSPAGKNYPEEIFARYGAFRKRLKDGLAGIEMSSPLSEAMDSYTLREKFDEKQKHAFEYAVKTELSDDLGADPKDLSVSYASADVQERNDVLMLGGYDTLVDHLAEGLDIRLQTVVGKIHYEDSGVRVEAGDKSFTGRRILSTLPLGVLKAKKVQFDPALPENKIRAISNLGVAGFSLIHIRFPSVFWDEKVHFIGNMPQNTNETVTILNRHAFSNAPILTILNSGDASKRWDAMRGHDVIMEIMQVLQRIYGQKTLRPSSWLCTSWSQDPYALGAFSYIPVGSSIRDRQTLAEPVLNRLFFAGEATSSDWNMPSVHSAYLTGLREAKNIDKSLRS